MAEVAKAYVSLIPSARGFESGVSRAIDGDTQKAGKRAGAKAGKAFGGSFNVGVRSIVTAGAALAIGGGALQFLKDSNAEAREAQKVGALTTQVIKTTGGVAKVTANQIERLSTAISNKVGIDDEAIQSGANLLLTFKNVRNEVGKGNKVFDRATRAAVDLSAAGFGDLAGASKQLGKALNDPLKGITALSRSGVTFTQQQKDQIKVLVKSGKTLQAQKIILKEVEAQVGGAAEAQATAGDKAAVSVANLKEQIGTALLPTIDDLATFTSNKLVPSISGFVTGMQDGTGPGGDLAEVLGDLKDVGEGVLNFFEAIPGPVKKYGAEIAIAALVVSKLNSGLGGFTAGLTKYSAGLTAAQGRQAKFSAGLRGLGSGITNVAGAGGMLLLADSTNKAGTSMGVLEAAAGGALTGAALGAFGGPVGAGIGAAIGGIAGATINLATATDDAGNAAKVSIGSWKDYSSTLQGVEAATTAATRAMILQRLEKAGLLAATQRLGLSDRQAVNAVLGVSNARRILAQRLREGHGLTNAQREALVRETGAIDKARLATLRNNVAIADTKNKLRDAKAALDNFNPARIDIDTEQAKGRLLDLGRILRQLAGQTALPKVNVSTNALDPTGLIPKRRRRAVGGPVFAGSAYLVGERGPEMFTTSQRGRIASTNALRQTSSDDGVKRVVLQVDGHQFTGFMSEIADARIDGARGYDGMTERAFT